MALYDALADLPLEIDEYALEGRARTISPEFERLTTTIHLQGGGEEGLGEDVTYSPELQTAQQEAGPVLPLAGRWTLDSFSRQLGELDLFGGRGPDDARVPRLPALGVRVGRRRPRPAPGRTVAGRRPRARSAADHVRRLAAARRAADRRAGHAPARGVPELRFKLDATPSWGDELLATLAATGAVASIDFKGAYKGTAGRRRRPTRTLYRRCAEAFPEAWLEDPDLTLAAADEALRPHRNRITWDAPIHGVADIEALPFQPDTINVKPSRIGSWRELLRTYEWCADRGIISYGGGQSELGVGRGQIQYLAALFHPGEPNDIAPSGYDWSDFPETGLPPTPLPADLEPTGFRLRS